MIENTILGTPPYNPQVVIPLPNKEYNYTGGSLIQFFASFAVLILLVYILPANYALWLPFVVLLGYAVNRQDVINQILTRIEKTVNDFYH